MIDIKKKLLVQEIINSKKEIILGCKEISIKTCEQKIAVWRKRSRHRMNTKHIGDGVQIVRIHERSLENKMYLDVQSMLIGMSLYKEFDEYTGEMKIYLYKFSKKSEDIDFINKILSFHKSNVSVKLDGKFILLENGFFGKNEKDIIHGKLDSISSLSSFLFGLVLVYGTFDKEDGALHSARIQLPLVGSIAPFQELLSQITRNLSEYGIYSVVGILDQKYGQLRQMSIGDGELLKTFAHRLNFKGSSKSDTMKKQKASLLEWIRKSEETTKIIEQLEKSVVKLVRR